MTLSETNKNLEERIRQLENTISNLAISQLSQNGGAKISDKKVEARKAKEGKVETKENNVSKDSTGGAKHVGRPKKNKNQSKDGSVKKQQARPKSKGSKTSKGSRASTGSKKPKAKKGTTGQKSKSKTGSKTGSKSKK